MRTHQKLAIGWEVDNIIVSSAVLSKLDHNAYRLDLLMTLGLHRRKGYTTKVIELMAKFLGQSTLVRSTPLPSVPPYVTLQFTRQYDEFNIQWVMEDD